jgi:hypothetical protein
MVVAVVSELVLGGGGLGEMMIRSYRYGDVRTAFATISLIGSALYKLAQWLRGPKTRLRFVHVAHAIACAMVIHRLYGELAASLVRATTDRWAPGAAPARAGVKLDNCSCQSAFEDACAMVAKLGLATDKDELAIDADRVAQFVTDRSRAGQITLPPIDDVFAAWIWCAIHGGHACARRLPFVPHDDIRPVMDALAASGYAKPLGNAFIWTDRIGRAMQMSGLWDENNLSREELEEREVDLDMREALASIPEDVRHSALSGDRTAVGKALAARWVDGVWLPDTVDEAPWYRLAGVVPQAKRLMELVEGADDPLTRDVN